jgi:hypothetical protein
MRYFPLVPFFLFWSFLIYSQSKQPSADLRGSITADNVYDNPALGLSITLPGSWVMLAEKSSDSNTDRSGCNGPLCGNPEIDVQIQTKPGSDTGYKLFLAGYKLSTVYLNRNKYPLKWFAGIMLAGSLGSDLAPVEKQALITLDGRPAYRLLAARPGETTARVIGYVSEADGYVFLLVGATPTNPQTLQSAIEGLKFESAKH